MGYRIRYGVEAKRFSWVRLQVVAALVLLAVKWLGGGEMVRAVFCPGASVLEMATAELVQGVARGEGWYQSLARFCGRIINGAG